MNYLKHKENQHSDIEEAKRVLKIEAEAILNLYDTLGDAFIKAIDTICLCNGKLIVTGIGKSGHIGQKISSTFSSTGTPSFFIHPAEGGHGDLGVFGDGDVVLAISYSGETSELNHILEYVARKGLPIIAITSQKQSSLGQAAGVVISVEIKEEACPLGLAPTASSTATLAMGDALAMSVLKRRGFKTQDFAELHPSGSLGRRLLTRIKDVMHSKDSLPLVKKNAGLREIIAVMTRKEVRGVAGVINDQFELIGIITDGDIRRRLEKVDNPLNDVATDIMSINPKVISCDEMAEKALLLMEQFQIQSLFVVDQKSVNMSKAPIGLVHLQDLLKNKIR